MECGDSSPLSFVAEPPFLPRERSLFAKLANSLDDKEHFGPGSS